MDRPQQLAYLNQALLADLPQLAGEVAALPGDKAVQRQLLRALMNVRPAEFPLAPEFLAVQDAFLSAEREAKGVVDAACHTLMAAQGHDEPTGHAKITPGYNLPAKYVLHTVGPIIYSAVTAQDREALASCYRSCLALAAERGLHSVAFCCISTGEFHFPNAEAAAIAVETVTGFLRTPSSIQKVIFNVFQDKDLQIYRSILSSAL